MKNMEKTRKEFAEAAGKALKDTAKDLEKMSRMRIKPMKVRIKEPTRRR